MTDSLISEVAGLELRRRGQCARRRHANVYVAVVRSVAQLGVSLGMTPTAEGVETREQLALARLHASTCWAN